MMDLKLEVRGIDALMKACPAFQKALPGAILNGIRRPLRRRITKIKQRIRRECGLGESIWSGKGKAVGLDKLVTMIRARLAGDIGFRTIQTGVRLKGLAAMIDQGGRIKPHVIKRAWGRATVNHPGADVRAHNIARQEMDAAEGEITREINIDVQKLIAKKFPTGAAA